MKFKTTISRETLSVEKIMEWIKTRGGLAIWKSVNLSNPCSEWLSPANQEDGKPYTKPNWQAGNVPEIVTDPAEIGIVEYKIVKEVRIALRMGSQGLSIKLTDHSSQKVRKACEEAGEGSTYYFGGDDGQTAYIQKPQNTVALSTLINEKPTSS